MLENLNPGMAVDMYVYDKVMFKVPLNISGVIASVDKNHISLVKDSFPFNIVSYKDEDIISVSKKTLPNSIYKTLVELSKIGGQIKAKEKELSDIKNSELLIKERLIEEQFLNNFSVDGAINYLNSTVGKFGPININDNIISFAFFKNESGQIEVSIKVSKKFEFYNTTSQADINKAADTYAPELKDELKSSLSLFGNIFLVNRYCNKISDYLYESISEYNGEFFCKKEDFFGNKKKLVTFLEKSSNKEHEKVF